MAQPHQTNLLVQNIEWKKSQNGVFRQKQLNRWNAFLWAVFFLTIWGLFCFVLFLYFLEKLNLAGKKYRSGAIGKSSTGYSVFWLYRILLLTSALLGIPLSVHSSFRASLRKWGCKDHTKPAGARRRHSAGFPTPVQHGAFLFRSCVCCLVCFQCLGCYYVPVAVAVSDQDREVSLAGMGRVPPIEWIISKKHQAMNTQWVFSFTSLSVCLSVYQVPILSLFFPLPSLSPAYPLLPLFVLSPSPSSNYTLYYYIDNFWSTKMTISYGLTSYTYFIHKCMLEHVKWPFWKSKRDHFMFHSNNVL